ncbi:MAG: DUF2634 domain-containing protein [Methanobrevibacter sp.]|jgi:phage baseplate assembly protein W|nr:DUF2634 domain-containing protein [Methanobrevibacter sp.]
MVNYGTDIASHGSLDSKGQVPTVSGIDNIKQALKNRLLTELGVYVECCDDYGTTLRDMLNKDLTENNIEWIKTEIRMTVLKDPRIASCEVKYVKNRGFHYSFKAIDDDTEYEGEVA